MMEDANRKNPLAARLLIHTALHPVPVFGRVLRILLGSDFYAQVIGHGLFIPHPYGIIVHSAVKIGNDVTIFHDVTLGGTRIGSGVPTIKSNVLIGAGAKVLGGVTIGDFVNVGANAVVTRDVPDGATVVGYNEVHWRIDSRADVKGS